MEGPRQDILVADNHPLSRAGLMAMLASEPGVRGLREAGSYSETIGMLCGEPAIGLAAVSLELPGMGRIQGLRKIRSEFPAIRLIVIAETRDRDSILDALRAGVHGYVPNDLPARDMLMAFRSVIDGQIYVPALMSDVSPKPAPRRNAQGSIPDTGLTVRQAEVLDLLAVGHSNKEIARLLRIAEGTVKVHITAAFRMLGVRNRVCAAAALHGRASNGFEHDATIPGLLAEEPSNGSGVSARFFGLTPAPTGR